MLVFVGGCSTGQTYQGPIWTQSQAERVLKDALSASLPDDRRRAIEHVSGSKFVGSDPCLHTLDVIFRTDSSTLVRRSAARGLGMGGRKEAVGILRGVLSESIQDGSFNSFDGLLRADCLAALKNLAEMGILFSEPESLIQTVRTVIEKDASQPARVAAAALLGCIQHPHALDLLIETLSQADFAVVYEAERSLIKLTGCSHDRNPQAWKNWLIRHHQDPFVRSGKNPEPGSIED